MDFKNNVCFTINSLPSKPGVYLFKNDDGQVLYVGKAKDLKKRVSSYLDLNLTDWKTSGLRENTDTLEFRLTDDELSALILEAKLIEALQPPLNIQLKNRNPFLYFHFSKSGIPKLELTRTSKKDGLYFGPFLNKSVARELFDLLNKTFGLRICNRKISGGCLYYHMGQCAGHCLETFDCREYLNKIGMVELFFKQGPKKFIKDLTVKIDKLNADLKFEESVILSRYQRFLQNSKLDLQNAGTANMLMMEKEHTQHIWLFDDTSDLIVLLDNKHQHISVKQLFLQSNFPDLTKDEVLCEFYRNNLPPLVIFTNFVWHDKKLFQDFIKTWYQQDFVLEVVYFDQFKDNPTFLDLALEIFNREVYKFNHLAKELQLFFGSKSEIRRIDCFDVSHHQELAIVASCVRFTDGRPDKNFYRHFKIKTTKKPNDYQSLREVVYRRYASEDPENLPDLVLIDGGKGQLNAVKNLFPELCFASLAKREERVFFANPSEEHRSGIVLCQQSIIGTLLTNIRNHAHNFAIRFHRKLKDKIGNCFF